MKILFLCHNIPFPANKGEKIRNFYIIKHLAKNHEVHLLSFVKDREDLKYLNELEKHCTSASLFPINKVKAKLQSLLCLATPLPLTFGYYFSFAFLKALRSKLKNESFDLLVSSCSSTAQYLLLTKEHLQGTKTICDFIDIDSYKWGEFSVYEKFPISWIYKQEKKRLEKWERRISQFVDLSLVTTYAERDKLSQINFLATRNTEVLHLGVNLEKFSAIKKENAGDTFKMLFLGQMNYLPNIDAVIYFYLNILPIVKQEVSNVLFQIVGRAPTQTLKDICKEADVTGEVASIEPYLAQASVFVAPFRMSFGIQNKILEAMAAGIPIVTTSNTLRTLQAKKGKELLVADNPVDFARHIIELKEEQVLREKVTQNAKSYIQKHHNWPKILQSLDDLIKNLS